MSEFDTIQVTKNNPKELGARIVANLGLMNKSRTSTGPKGKENALRYERNMNHLLDHWPDGEPREIDYKPVAQEAEEQAQKMRKVLDKEIAV